MVGIDYSIDAFISPLLDDLRQGNRTTRSLNVIG